MTIKLNDRVKQTTLTSGVADLVLTGTPGGFQSFLEGIGDGNTTYYVLESDSKWETGVGTYTQSTNTLSRDTILTSSAAGSKISINGVSTVFCTIPATRTLFRDAAGGFALPSQFSADTVSSPVVSGTRVVSTGQALFNNIHTSGEFIASGNAYIENIDATTVDLKNLYSSGLADLKNISVTGDATIYDASIGTINADDINSSGDSKLNYVQVTGTLDATTLNLQTVNTLDLTSSGQMTLNHVVVSGDIQSSGLLTLKRTNAGNFFHAYVADGNDRTVSLYSDGGGAPQWKLGLKSGPSNATTAPEYGYIFGEDGNVGFVANSLNSMSLTHGGGLSVKNQNNTILTVTSTTGVSLTSFTAAYPALIVQGASAQSADIQRWEKNGGTKVAAIGNDGGLELPSNVPSTKTNKLYNDGGTVKFNNKDISGDAKSSNVLINSASGYAISGWVETHVAGQTESGDGKASDILLNSASGYAISGWVETHVSSQDHVSVALAAAIGSGNANLFKINNNTGDIINSGNKNLGVINSVSGWVIPSVESKVADLVDSAPAALNTLNELAAALGDDQNFSTTVTNLIAAKSDFSVASGIAVSGWVETYTARHAADILRNSASGNANLSSIGTNTTSINNLASEIDFISGIFNGDLRSNSASGVNHANDILRLASSGTSTNTSVTNLTTELRTESASGVNHANDIIRLASSGTNHASDIIRNAASGTAVLAELRAESASGVNHANDIIRLAASGTNHAADIIRNSASGNAIQSRTLTAGDGLSGGGDLSTNRTFAVIGDSGVLITDKVHANLADYTVQSTTANGLTTTASRTYAIQVDSNDKLVVNVPWTAAEGGGGGSSEDILANSASGLNNLNDIIRLASSGSNHAADIIRNSTSGTAVLAELRIESASGVNHAADIIRNAASGTATNTSVTNLTTELRTESASGVNHANDIIRLATSGTATNTLFTNLTTELRTESASGVNISGYNEDYTDIKVAALVDSAPETLNTLNELAAAINDDASISTTLTNLITANTTELRTESASGVNHANDIIRLAASGTATNTSVSNLTTELRTESASGVNHANDIIRLAASGTATNTSVSNLTTELRTESASGVNHANDIIRLAASGTNHAADIIRNAASGTATNTSVTNLTTELRTESASGVNHANDITRLATSGTNHAADIIRNAASGTATNTSVTNLTTELRTESASGVNHANDIIRLAASGTNHAADIIRNATSGTATNTSVTNLTTELRTESASGVNHAADIIRNAASGAAVLAELRIESASGTQAFAELRSGFAASGLNIKTNVGDSTTKFIQASGMSVSGIMISGGAPPVTHHMLYNEGGTLKWDGSAIGGGGASDINGLSDCLVENNSIFLGNDPSSTTNGANNNIGLGTTALEDITTGDGNVAIGYNASKDLTTGNYSVAIGYEANVGATTFQNNNVVIGKNAGESNSSMTSKSSNVIIGTSAGKLGVPQDSVIIGSEAGKHIGDASSTQAYVIAIGGSAMGSSSSSDVSKSYGSIGIGRRAGNEKGRGTNAHYSIYIGWEAGYGDSDHASNMLYIANDEPSKTGAGGTIIKSDMEEKHLAIGQADLLVNAAGSGCLQIYAKDPADSSLFIEAPIGSEGDLMLAASGSHTLLQVDHRGTVHSSGVSVSGVYLGNYVPTSTSNTLYNEGGTLKFNGSAVGGGGGMSNFILEDGDGTEVTVGDGKEVKFVEGDGIDIDWTDVSDGSDGDPYDLTFTVDHDAASNYVANEHINHTSVTLTAGDGLTGGGDISANRTFTVVGGDGITANANDVAITAAQTTITSVYNASLKMGRGTENLIDFATTNNKIILRANNVDQVSLIDNVFGPEADSDVDLGTSAKRWKDAYVDSLTTTGDVTCGGEVNTAKVSYTDGDDAITIADGGAVTFSQSINQAHEAGALSTNSLSFDCSKSNYFEATVDQQVDDITFTNATAGQRIILLITNSTGDAHLSDGNGWDTITINGNTGGDILWAGGIEPTLTANGKDMYGIVFTSTVTTAYGFIIGQDIKA